MRTMPSLPPVIRRRPLGLNDTATSPSESPVSVVSLAASAPRMLPRMRSQSSSVPDSLRITMRDPSALIARIWL